MIVCDGGRGGGRMWDITIKAGWISGNTETVLCEARLKREYR